LYYHYTIGQDALFIQSGRKFNHACELRKCFYLRSHNLHNKVKKILNYIDGKLLEPQSGSYLDNIDPSRGKVYSLIPDSDHSDIDLAAIAARNAFPAWSASCLRQRDLQYL
jgi:hypothetical protein